MRQDLSQIVMVIDRSGSMASCKSDAEGGINSFIEEQKKHIGEANFTLVQFDTEYEFVYSNVPISDVSKYKLVPRGWTALLDAVGRAISETGDTLSKMDETDRPALVVFVIVTDGFENSSKEFKLEQVREMIKHQKEVYNWQFTFLGADDAAFEGEKMGVDSSAILPYNFRKHTGSAYKVASSNVCRMRSASFAGDKVSNEYSQDERNSVK